ncbi:murein hydrolase activator EnvC [Phenylobacterium sp.]|uniref:murein hydrolase activator EnvC family protein n=1 Tax=Phenylobacterium sp. TaxID=1871053 RepID=UPI00272F346B|nr:peptidoglycan DD-metalloendopeptidase family protein [Phenylobacterium sp.]MDP1618953.1 peptidoglycan DD-metalloendopeptidase family protein [Phenylobacterium sp.]MDP1987681.1 peptidoglycan DD-metalloendopeptidase family protein [Phenylobacterium sp.]
MIDLIHPRGGRLAALTLLLAGAAGLGLVSAAEPLQSLDAREQALNAERGRNDNQLARLLSILQQLKRDPPPALLVAPGDARDAVRAAILVKAMTPELQRRAQVYAAEASDLARQRRLAAVASETLFTAESERADARPLPEAVDPSGAALRGYAAAPAEYLVEGPVTPPEALLYPAEGPVTHRFGETLHSTAKYQGVTILTPRGARVQSPGAGLVQYVGPVRGWGVILILRMSGGYHLVLAGLDRVSVDVGQTVAAGGPVGWMADEGQSPSELYLEVREKGAPVDPARWLKKEAG